VYLCKYRVFEYVFVCSMIRQVCFMYVHTVRMCLSVCALQYFGLISIETEKDSRLQTANRTTHLYHRPLRSLPYQDQLQLL
jgi:hypothetical protein